MKELKKIGKIFVLFFTVFLFNLAVAFAQDPPDPGDEPGDDDDPVGGNAPIDGGALFLLLAGTTYGIYKLKGHKKRKTKIIR